MSLRTIAAEWQTFATFIFQGVNVGEVQQEEMRKAFFAGAFAMLRSAREIGEEHVSEDQGADYLEERWQELTKFYDDLIKENSRLN